jgi:AAA domain
MSEEKAPALVDPERLARLYGKMTTAADLETMHFDPLRWLVPDLLVEGGVAILAGRPKIGKSWFALQLANSIAEGTPFFGRETNRNEVVYLALEDSLRRLKSRSDLIGSFWSTKLRFFTEWSKGSDALDDLRNLLEYVGTGIVKLLVVDVIARIFPAETDHNDYGMVGDFLAAIQRLSVKYGTAVLLVHHFSKSAKEDFVDSLIGSTAYSSTTDTVFGLKRARGTQEAILSVTGRDVEEQELGLSFSLPGGWQCLGPASEVKMSEERKRIIDLLDSEGSLTPKEIALHLDSTSDAVRQLLFKMKRAGLVSDMGGRYANTKNNGNAITGEAS